MPFRFAADAATVAGLSATMKGWRSIIPSSWNVGEEKLALLNDLADFFPFFPSR
jgi:hypothetical protein